MKKLMMMAMMLVASATAFAGDSDALKTILKVKDYAEAQSLINSSLAQLANDAEKAKAWLANGAQPTDTVRGLLKKVEA